MRTKGGGLPRRPQLILDQLKFAHSSNLPVQNLLNAAQQEILLFLNGLHMYKYQVCQGRIFNSGFYRLNHKI